MAFEVHRLSALVNELTLRCVLNGVDLPNELCPDATRIPPPTCLDVRFESFVPWAQIARLQCDQQQGLTRRYTYPALSGGPSGHELSHSRMQVYISWHVSA